MADAKTTGASAANGSAQHRTHNDGSSDRAYTIEQKAAVLRVRKCTPTAFYDILGLESVKTTIDDSGIKKAYRKLSLLTHPDKNGYAGADEAFKMVSRAFQVLSDAEKKKRFDQFGGDPDNRFSSAGAGQSSPFSGFARSNGAARGGGMFEEEISPEELFRQFFGGGMGGGGFGGPFGGGLFGDTGPGFVFNLGGGPMGMGGPGVRVHQFGGNRPRRRPRDANGNETQPTAADMLRNFLPLILLFLVPILSSLFSGGGSTPKMPAYRMDTPQNPYTHSHVTSKLRQEYFVNPVDVVSYSNRDWTRMNDYVDQNLVRRLNHECENEQTQYQRLIQEAQGWFSIDQEKLREAKALEQRSCNRLRGLPLRQAGYYY